MGWDALGSQFVESLFTGRRSCIYCREDTQNLSAQPVNSHGRESLPKKFGVVMFKKGNWRLARTLDSGESSQGLMNMFWIENRTVRFIELKCVERDR